MNCKILTFFFGSPHSGFSAYPSDYTNWVSGLDTKKSEFPFICKYIVNDNKAIIKYIEYNLSDIERSGRNFGIWLQIENFKFKNDFDYDEVVNFIKDFVNEIFEEKEVFFQKGRQPHFYIIKSFKDVDTALMINIFNEEFIKTFKDDLVPITSDDVLEKDLIVYEEPKVKATNVPFTISNNSSKDIAKQKKSDTPKKREKEKTFLEKLGVNTTTLLLLFLMFLNFMYSLWNKINLNEKIEGLHSITSVSEPNSSSNENDLSNFTTSNTDADDRFEESETQVEKSDYVIVKKGNSLLQIIDDYNKGNNTKYTLEVIAKYNSIKKEEKEGKDGKLMINYRIQANQKIIFPNQ